MPCASVPIGKSPTCISKLLPGTTLRRNRTEEAKTCHCEGGGGGGGGGLGGDDHHWDGGSGGGGGGLGGVPTGGGGGGGDGEETSCMHRGLSVSATDNSATDF